MRAEIYESVDKLKNGGTLYTRIYCFQTDKPILNPVCDKTRESAKKQSCSRAVLLGIFIKKWLRYFLNLFSNKICVSQ